MFLILVLLSITDLDSSQQHVLQGSGSAAYLESLKSIDKLCGAQFSVAEICKTNQPHRSGTFWKHYTWYIYYLDVYILIHILNPDIFKPSSQGSN